MGFLSQFNNSQRQDSNSLDGIMQMAQSLSAQNGGAEAVIDQLAKSGATCTMPSGKQIAVSDIVTMSKTMSPQQLLMQLMQA